MPRGMHPSSLENLRKANEARRKPSGPEPGTPKSEASTTATTTPATTKQDAGVAATGVQTAERTLTASTGTSLGLSAEDLALLAPKPSDQVDDNSADGTDDEVRERIPSSAVDPEVVGFLGSAWASLVELCGPPPVDQGERERAESAIRLQMAQSGIPEVPGWWLLVAQTAISAGKRLLGRWRGAKAGADQANDGDSRRDRAVDDRGVQADPGDGSAPKRKDDGGQGPGGESVRARIPDRWQGPAVGNQP